MKLKIIPLGGGPGMVTNNMYVYEWGNDQLIVDCGIGFPDDKVSNDILIPDINYLKQSAKNNQRFRTTQKVRNLNNIHGILLTHGHDDHHAALPHILPEIGYPPVYASRLTAGFCQDKLQEFNIKQKINIVKESDQLKIGPFTIDPIHVTHSVPDTFHYMITTPVGAIYHGSDFKFDLTPLDNRTPNFSKIISLSKKGVLCLLSDCLRSERSGFTPSESTVSKALHRELSHCPGRLIFTTMSSQIHRIQQAIDVAHKYGRKIAFIGRSMESNAQIASRLGFLHLPKKSLATKQQIKKIPDHKLCLIVAGSQGQESSSLTRYAAGSHRFLKLRPADKVIYSVDIIPGNEQAVYNVIDELNKKGLDVVYQETVDDLHVSGHASAGELQLLMEMTNPHYLYPIGGSFRHMRQYQRLAEQIGFRKDQTIFPQSAQVVEFDQNGTYRLAETLKLNQIRINQNELRPKQKSR
ncbi:ribonuclease J [Patescibacteria group bacterium]